MRCAPCSPTWCSVRSALGSGVLRRRRLAGRLTPASPAVGHQSENRGSRALSSSRGSTTAEFATALPAVVLILACCLGGVQVVGLQVRLTDAAASAARALARGDSVTRAAGLVQVAVAGASLSPERRSEFVCARVTAAALPGIFAGITLRARSCALAGGL